MKLSNVADPISLGMREIEERKALAAQAAAALEADFVRRALDLANEYHWSTTACHSDNCPGVVECCHAEGGPKTRLLLRLIEDNPSRYLRVVPVEEPKKPLKVKRTPGQVRSIEDTIRGHLLAVESLARLLPEETRKQHRDPLYHAVEALELMGRP